MGASSAQTAVNWIERMTAANWIALLQVGAALLIAGVAVVTLWRASKTLLQPLRTESFKAQLEELRALLRLIPHHTEEYLRGAAGFDQVLAHNTQRMLARFFRDVYGIEPRPELSDVTGYSIIREDAVPGRVIGRLLTGAQKSRLLGSIVTSFRHGET